MFSSENRYSEPVGTSVAYTVLAASTEDADNVKKTEGGLRTKSVQRVRPSPMSSLVSIITVSLNADRHIRDTIQNVRNQSYPDIEYIVIDGASSDRTVEILCENDSNIDYWLSEPDRGIYDAWNKGLAIAQGEWIGFLGVGDEYRRDAIECYMQEIAKYPKGGLDYISSKVEYIDPGRNVHRAIGKPWSWRTFRRYMCVAHVGSLHHRQLFDTYGRYNTDYRIAGDYELLLRARDRLRTAFVDRVTASMRGGGVSNRSLSVFEESRRAKQSSGKRAPFLAHLEKYVAIGKFLGRNTWYHVRSRLGECLHKKIA